MWLAAPAALVCGGLWTIAGVIVIGQPTPPDWPGYVVDILPLTVAAVVFGLIALVGCWARQRDAPGGSASWRSWSRSSERRHGHCRSAPP